MCNECFELTAGRYVESYCVGKRFGACVGDDLLKESGNMRPTAMKPQFMACGELRNPKQIFAVVSTCVMSVLNSQLGGVSKVIASVNVLGRVWVTI